VEFLAFGEAWGQGAQAGPLPEPRGILPAPRADFRYRLKTECCRRCGAARRDRDRYLFTALARDAARGLDFEWLLDVYDRHSAGHRFYFAVSPETSAKRIAADRTPNFYEAGQDVTDIADPFRSYTHFIGRVIQEYEALAHIFSSSRGMRNSRSSTSTRIRGLYEHGGGRPWINATRGADRLDEPSPGGDRSMTAPGHSGAPPGRLIARSKGPADARCGRQQALERKFPAGEGCRRCQRGDASAIFFEIAQGRARHPRAAAANAGPAVRRRPCLPALSRPLGRSRAKTALGNEGAHGYAASVSGNPSSGSDAPPACRKGLAAPVLHSLRRRTSATGSRNPPFK